MEGSCVVRVFLGARRIGAGARTSAISTEVLDITVERNDAALKNGDLRFEEIGRPSGASGRRVR
jgi:hypothetical protein